MIAPVFKGTCKKGKLVIYNANDFFMHCCTLEDKDCEIIVRKELKQKSNKQNRYYRGVIVKLIAKQCGYSEDKAHGVLQYEFFRYQDEKGKTYIKSTELKAWNTVEWEDKMSEIRNWASEFLGLYLPTPNEIEFY